MAHGLKRTFLAGKVSKATDCTAGGSAHYSGAHPDLVIRATPNLLNARNGRPIKRSAGKICSVIPAQYVVFLGFILIAFVIVTFSFKSAATNHKSAQNHCPSLFFSLIHEIALELGQNFMVEINTELFCHQCSFTIHIVQMKFGNVNWSEPRLMIKNDSAFSVKLGIFLRFSDVLVQSLVSFQEYGFWKETVTVTVQNAGYRAFMALNDTKLVIRDGQFKGKHKISFSNSIKAEEFKGKINHLRNYVTSGGRLFVLWSEGGEKKLQTNINFLTEEYGIAVNNDGVIRTVYHKYPHPKEVFVNDGILNRTIGETLGKTTSGNDDDIKHTQSLTFLYPYGATLSTVHPAVTLLSTGNASYPHARPVCAIYNDEISGGKLLVLGSCHMFSDAYIDKEDNSKIRDVLFQFLTNDRLVLNSIDARDPEIADYHTLPDMKYLAAQCLGCVEEAEELPADYTKLFDMTLHTLDNSLLPNVVDAYEQIGVKHEMLGLVKPHFENPLPPLAPAVFPAQFKALPHPALELFDLDEEFSSETQRLAQLTNKCQSNDDLDYYIREAGDILGIMSRLAQKTPPTAKQILEYVLNQIVEFKKLNQERLETPSTT